MERTCGPKCPFWHKVEPPEFPWADSECHHPNFGDDEAGLVSEGNDCLWELDEEIPFAEGA